jgi:antirestriction protein ArdC
MVTSEDWLAFLRMASRFHRYSVNNVLLILFQAPEATQVASYTTWKTLGRQVRKGEKGIKILAPCRYRAAAEESTSSTPVVPEWEIRGYRVASVFDIKQTDGEGLPSHEAPKLLAGEAPAGMTEAICKLITKEGFTVSRANLGAANGITRYLTREVVVAPHLSDRATAKTLCHELAHVRMHEDDLETRSRELIETEAESCAYLVAHAWGLDSGDYSIPYVAHWAQSADLVKSTMQRVVATARQIIDESGLN